MIEATKVKRLENIIAIIYCSLVLIIYLLGRYFLDMYTANDSSAVGYSLAAILLPISIYITLRVNLAQGGKWYGYIGNFVMAFGGLMFFSYTSCMKADLLLGALLKPHTVATAPLSDVKKRFIRKIGFDRTDVTFVYQGKTETFEAGRNIYFLLKDKKAITITIGRSFTNNYFVTDLHLPASERWAARWEYLKDWAYRQLWVAVFIIVIMGATWLKVTVWPTKPGVKPNPISWQKFSLIVFGIVMGLFLLAYLALLIYVKFIAKPR